jgi:hypothetical protein
MAFPADTDDAHPTEAPPPPPPLRASDADRRATVHVLQDAVARGLLTAEEGSDRMAAAFAAVHRKDLAPLTADLAPAPSTVPGWRVLALMTIEQLRASLTRPATGRIHPARAAVAVVVVLLVLVALGSLVGELFFDGGRGPGPGGFGRGRP